MLGGEYIQREWQQSDKIPREKAPVDPTDSERHHEQPWDYNSEKVEKSNNDIAKGGEQAEEENW